MNVDRRPAGDADAHVVDHLARADLEHADPLRAPSAASATASYGNGHSVIGRT